MNIHESLGSGKPLDKKRSVKSCMCDVDHGVEVVSINYNHQN